jgi:hypothetical protein
MWKNTVGRGRQQMTIWRMRFAYCKSMATNKHLEYVILIAFPLQKYLHKRASMLWYNTLPLLLNTVYLKFTFETGDIDFCNWGYN